MAQELAVQASVGGVVLLLMTVWHKALEGAAGDRSHQPTLVAGPLTTSGSRSSRRVVPSVGAMASRCGAGAVGRGEPYPSVN